MNLFENIPRTKTLVYICGHVWTQYCVSMHMPEMGWSAAVVATPSF